MYVIAYRNEEILLPVLWLGANGKHIVFINTQMRYLLMTRVVQYSIPLNNSLYMYTIYICHVSFKIKLIYSMHNVSVLHFDVKYPLNCKKK